MVDVGHGVAAEDQRATVGGREVDVEHLDGGKPVERGPAASGRSLDSTIAGKYMAPILPEARSPKKAVRLHYTRSAPVSHCIHSGSTAQSAEKSFFNGRVEKVGLTRNDRRTRKEND